MLLLIIVIASLIILLLFLYNNYQQQRNHFHQKEIDLRNTIATIKKKQNVLNNQIKLSEDFNANYQKTKITLEQSIYEAHIELLNTQFKKKEN